MPNELREPDWGRLRQIGDEMDGLLRSGGWTKAGFFRLFRQALAAARDYPHCAEFVANRSRDRWLEEFHTSPAKEPAA